MFKGTVKEILPKTIDDITAITSIMRPGPLSAHMDKMYARRKNGEEQWSEPLPNTLDIVQDTFGTIIYQEQPMLIAQRVAGFDGNQSDSFLRKAMAKKKLELLKLCQQWFTYGKINQEAPAGYDPENHNQPMYDPEGKYGAPIKGGIANGYDEHALNEFFSSLEGYASYLFNKSHAFSYSVLSCFTAYLAHHCKTQFMAQVLTFEKDNKKIDFYVDVCRKYGINVLPPDINHSEKDFSVHQGNLLYGLNKIAKVGKTCDAIIENRPYNSIEDLQNKVKPKKDVFENLIKAGCFDKVNKNRIALLNELYSMRKDKDKETKEIIHLDEDAYDKSICREYEIATLKTSLTYPSFYKQLPINKTYTVECILESFEEKRDKRGNMMGYYKLLIDGEVIKALCFASVHTGIRLELERAYKTRAIIYLNGKKDDKGIFLVSSKTNEDKVKFYEPFTIL